MYFSVKRISICFLLIVASLYLISCSSSKSPVISGNTGSGDTSYTYSVLSDKSGIDAESIISALINKINDDIWYNGSFSVLYGFEMQKVSFEVYAGVKDKRNDYVIFTDSVKVDPVKFPVGSTERFCTILMYKLSEGGEYSDCITRYFMSETLDQARNTLKNLDKPCLKGEISFGKAVEPNFLEMTDEKEEKVKKIKEYLESVKLPDNNQGTYRASIINFRDNAHYSSIILEDEKGSVWLMQIGFKENGDIYTAINFKDTATDPELAYNVAQCKNVILDTVEIIKTP